MTIEQIRKCRLCGYSGLDVSPGVFRKKDWTFVTIARCQDHAACETRRAERVTA